MDWYLSKKTNLRVDGGITTRSATDGLGIEKLQRLAAVKLSNGNIQARPALFLHLPLPQTHSPLPSRLSLPLPRGGAGKGGGPRPAASASCLSRRVGRMGRKAVVSTASSSLATSVLKGMCNPNEQGCKLVLARLWQKTIVSFHKFHRSSMSLDIPPYPLKAKYMFPYTIPLLRHFLLLTLPCQRLET